MLAQKSFSLCLHQCDAIDAIAFNEIGLIDREEMGKEGFCVLVRMDIGPKDTLQKEGAGYHCMACASCALLYYSSF